MSNYDFRPITVELYLDLAAHLISLPETHEIPGAVEWLGERILSGMLPDHAAYQACPFGFCNESSAAVYSALCAFVHPDTENNSDLSFMNSMKSAAEKLRQRGLPPFPRESELISPDE